MTVLTACRAAGKAAGKAAAGSAGSLPYRKETALLVFVVIGLGLISYSRHCRWVTSEAYSSPSIVLISGWGPYR